MSGPAERYSLEVVIDELPELPNRLQRKHWHRIRAHATKWHWLVRHAVARKAPPTPLERARVTMVRHSKQEPDRDNRWAAWKPVLDGLIHAKVIVDDDEAHCEFHGGGWEEKPRGKGYVTISVEEMSGEEEE